MKRFVGIAAVEGLAAVFALFWLGGGRVTALRVLFAALVVGVGASAVPAALRLRRVPAGWLVRAQGAALLLIGAAAASAFYYDHPGLDRAAAYLRAAFPVLLFMALILVQSVIWIARQDGRALRSIWAGGRNVWLRWIALSALAIVIAAYFPLRRNYYPSHDFSIFAYIGERIRSGGLPYVDAWDHKPPLIFYLNALGLTFAGGNLMGIWLLEAVFLTGALLMLFRLIRGAYGDWIAVGAIFFGTLHLARLLDFGNYTEEFALLFQSAALVLAVDPGRRSKAGLWFASGLLMGLAFSLKQSLIGAWLGIGLTVVFEIGLDEASCIPDRLKRIAKGGSCLLAGFICINLFWIVYFATQGALRDYLYGSYTYNFIYTARSGAPRWATGWTTLTFLPELSPFFGFGLIGWFAALAKIVRSIRRGEINRCIREEWLTVWAAATLPFEVVSAGLSGMNYQHYFIPMVPAYLVLIAALMTDIWRWSCGRFLLSARRLAIGTGFFLLLMSLPVFPILGENYASRNPSAMTKTGDFLRENTDVEDKVLIWGGSAAPYLLSGRRAPSRYFIVKSLYDFSARMGTGRWETFLTEVRADPPKWIVFIPDQRMARVPFNEEGFCAADLATVPGEALAFPFLCERYRFREILNPGMNDAYGVFERVDQE